MSSRAAHASIRGYWAQLVASAVAWTRLGPNESLVVEGDEDFDKELRVNGILTEVVPHQLKDVAKPIGWDEGVRKSVLGFAIAFARFGQQGVSCFPTYVSTTSSPRTHVGVRTRGESGRCLPRCPP